MRSLSILLVSTMLFSEYTFSFPCTKPKFGEIKSLLQTVAVMGEEDRFPFDDYAKLKKVPTTAIERKYGATGILNCDNKFMQTAQLTGSHSVITTAAHLFYDLKTCEPKKFESCVFFLISGQSYIPHPISPDLQIGACPKDPYQRTDWAVIKLTTPAPKDFTPYQLPTGQVQQLRRDTDIVQVSGYARNFNSPNRIPRHITDCKVQGLTSVSDFLVKTDCDNGEGTSGSAQLLDSGASPTMVSMMISQAGRDEDGVAFDNQRAFSLAIPLSDDFLKATKKAVEETSK